PRQRNVKLVLVKKPFEAAGPTVARELYCSHDERRRIPRHVVRALDEEELRFGIEESADEPSASGPVDMAATSGRPSHRATSTSAASASTARSARRRSAASNQSRARIACNVRRRRATRPFRGRPPFPPAPLPPPRAGAH